MLQHVVDPEMCIQCSACEMACPVKAIECIAGRFCVDFDKCKVCAKCIEECPTGAVDCFIETDSVRSASDQAEWTALPSTIRKSHTAVPPFER